MKIKSKNMNALNKNSKIISSGLIKCPDCINGNQIHIKEMDKHLIKTIGLKICPACNGLGKKIEIVYINEN